MIKKSFIIFSVLILILSLFFVSAHRQEVQDEKFYFDKWLDNLWGKITGNPIFQRGGKQTPDLAPIENNQNRKLFSRAQSSQIQTSPTDFPDKEISLEITKKSEEIKELTSNLLELNNQYKKISSVKSRKKESISSELAKLAIERENKMINLAKENPVLFFNNVLSKEKRNLFPDKIKEHIEEEIMVAGELTTTHFHDALNPEKVRYIHVIKTNEENFETFLLDSRREDSIKPINFFGYKMDKILIGLSQNKEFNYKKINVQSISKIKPASNINTLILLVNYTDSLPVPFTTQEADDLIFNGQFNKFYQEQSYGKINFYGDVYGWINLPRDSVGECGTGVAGYNSNELDDYVINNVPNISNYELIVLINNCRDSVGGWAMTNFLHTSSFLIDNTPLSPNLKGLADIRINGNFANQNSVWTDANYPTPFVWTNLDLILTHEVGHVLGADFSQSLPHANGLDCGADSLASLDSCNIIEYGNPFGAMGNGKAHALHFNGFYKELLGWISPQDSLSITKSGTYTINALETSQGKKFAKIKMLNSNILPALEEKTLLNIKTPYYPYYLEYRKGVGFDSNLNSQILYSNQEGLMINKVTGYFLSNVGNNKRRMTYIIDANPTSSLWNQDMSEGAVLSDSSVFYDFKTGITIGPIIYYTNENITFNVSLEQPICINNIPTIKDLFVPEVGQTFEPGNILDIQFYLYNNDYPYCGFSDFEIKSSLPSQDWDAFGNGHQILEIRGDEVDIIYWTLKIPENTCTGSYPITFNVENLNSGLTATKTIYVNITGTTPCKQEVAPPEF